MPPEPAIQFTASPLPRIIRTRSIFGGLTVDLTPALAVTLVYTRDHRDFDDRRGDSHVHVAHTPLSRKHTAVLTRVPLPKKHKKYETIR